MIIQLNADNILNIHEGFERQTKERISRELKRFDEAITRVDIYITEEKGYRAGSIDLKCLLGVNLKGMQSVVVSEITGTLELSVNGAVEKIKTALDSINRISIDQEQYLMVN
jgi:hypothetical protein